MFSAALQEECYSDISYEAAEYACRTYDESQGTKFITHLKNAYHWYVLKWIKRQLKHDSRFTADSQFDESRLVTVDNSKNASYAVEQLEAVYSILRQANLSEWEQLLLDKHYKDGKSIAEMSRELNYAESTIRAHLANLIEKLKRVKSSIEQPKYPLQIHKA